LTAKLAGCALLIIFFLFAGSNAAPEILIRDDGKNVKPVFVAHDNWHSAIVLKRFDIPVAVLPEIKDFSGAQLVEFSWGDRDYFPAAHAGLVLTLKAAFWSRGSILHVVGYNDSIEKLFPGSEIVEIHLSEESFQRLLEFVSDTFSRPKTGTAAEPRPGLVPDGRFYLAEGKFSVLRTCNTWVAEALNFAGLPINPRGVITAHSLGNQLRQFSRPGLNERLSIAR
jgi:uncharacterized protein (TIGR02117 family)